MSSDFLSVPLGDLTVNYDYKRKPVKSSDRKAGPYPYYGASGVVDFVDSYLFDGEYLLIGEDGENMRTRQSPIAFIAKGKFWVNNHAHIVKANERSTTKYLKYALAVTDISTYLTGAVMPKLTQGNMNQIRIPCPPLDTQNKIVGLLGCLDDSIEALQNQNTALEDIAQRLFRSWFVNFDPVHAKAAGKEPEAMSAELAALFPSEFEDSELGPTPKGWTVGSLKDVSLLNPEAWTGRNHPAEISYIDLSGVKKNVFSEVTKYKFDEAPSRARRVLKKGDSLYGTVRPGNLSYGYVGANLEGLTGSTGFAVLRPHEAVSAEFVYCAMTLKENIERLVLLAEGAAYPAVRPEIVHEQKVTVPRTDVMLAFHEVTRHLFEKHAVNQSLIARLGELRDHLLPRLISGKLRLEVAEQVVAEALTA